MVCFMVRFMVRFMVHFRWRSYQSKRSSAMNTQQVAIGHCPSQLNRMILSQEAITLVVIWLCLSTQQISSSQNTWQQRQNTTAFVSWSGFTHEIYFKLQDTNFRRLERAIAPGFEIDVTTPRFNSLGDIDSVYQLGFPEPHVCYRSKSDVLHLPLWFAFNKQSILTIECSLHSLALLSKFKYCRARSTITVILSLGNRSYQESTPC